MELLLPLVKECLVQGAGMKKFQGLEMERLLLALVKGSPVQALGMEMRKFQGWELASVWRRFFVPPSPELGELAVGRAVLCKRQ